eukprot:6213530-Pleurochrysis_carterae.AAC.1
MHNGGRLTTKIVQQRLLTPHIVWPTLGNSVAIIIPSVTCFNCYTGGGGEEGVEALHSRYSFSMASRLQASVKTRLDVRAVEGELALLGDTAAAASAVESLQLSSPHMNRQHIMARQQETASRYVTQPHTNRWNLLLSISPCTVLEIPLHRCACSSADLPAATVRGGRGNDY